MGEIISPPKIRELVGLQPAIDNLSQSAACSLRELATAIEDSAPHEAFHVWELDCSELSFASAFMATGLFEAALGKRATSIYSISLIDGPSASEVLADLAKVKALKTHKYPRLSSIAKCVGSNTLYVGSSQDTPKRLAEHLGTCHAGTYGLRLSAWASHWPGRLRIEVRTYQDLDAEHLQILEDHLASRMRPILGKRGGK